MLCYKGPANSIISKVIDPTTLSMAFAVNNVLCHLLGDVPSPALAGFISDETGNLLWGLMVKKKKKLK